MKKERPESSGEILHAKHAFMPNSLGYCGPSEEGKILEHLHASTTGEDLVSALAKFEAAYPFIRMIAKSTGRAVFDYEVAEAYWIGNSLLEQVQTKEFFEFAHQGLMSRISKRDAKTLFRELGAMAKPHHTFYVLGMYSRSKAAPDSSNKLLRLMDSCRISWGKVVDVKKKTLLVERAPLALKDDRLSLGALEREEVIYDREISPFSEIESGDWVSLHWNFASERLTRRQLNNIRTYTAEDIRATNRLVDLLSKNGKKNNRFQ
jgi:hypothetical protein